LRPSVERREYFWRVHADVRAEKVGVRFPIPLCPKKALLLITAGLSPAAPGERTAIREEQRQFAEVKRDSPRESGDERSAFRWEREQVAEFVCSTAAPNGGFATKLWQEIEGAEAG
jgi:hypothetical protein